MKLSPTTLEDIPMINEWIDADPYHNTDPFNSGANMVTGKGLLSFCVQDDIGPVFFMRYDPEGDLIRISAQFGPEEVVSKRRVVVGLKKTFLPSAKTFAKERGFKGLIFESTSPGLIAFMDRLGFKPAENDDYVLRIEENNV